MLADCKRRTNDLGPGFECVTVGVVLVSATAQVLFMNREAQRLIDDCRGLSVRQGGLEGCHLRDTVLLRDTIRAVSGISQGTEVNAIRALRLARCNSQCPLELLISPIQPQTPRYGADHAGAVVYIIDPSFASGETQFHFAHTHGLTPAEERVATLIAMGSTARQAAEQLGLSYNTIKTHLKQIFAKTGAKRQGGLIRLMLTASEP